MTSIDAALRHRAAANPESLAFATSDERVTYSKLDAEVARVASGLSRIGVAPQERIAIVAPACWRPRSHGAVVVPGAGNGRRRSVRH